MEFFFVVDVSFVFIDVEESVRMFIVYNNIVFINEYFEFKLLNIVNY